MSRKQTINVLLSTFNGEKYLREQIESILLQEQVSIQLYIRDDGSTDRTRQIINDYRSDDRVSIKCGSNIGWRRSFMNLIQSVSYVKGQYYAFADQDDVWHPHKMIRAIEKINEEKPMVYHSNMTLVDSHMNFVAYKYPKDFSPKHAMPYAFLDGIGTGATMVFNDKMLQLLHRYTPNEPTAHDAYVIALGNLIGEVIYDNHSYILYRRHRDTATGFGQEKVQVKPSLWARFKRYKHSLSCPYSIRASQILSGYQSLLTPFDSRFLRRIANYQTNYLDKIFLLMSPKFKASGLRKTLQIKYRVLCNTL